MKTMTCRELGGTCDQKLSADSWDEMVKVMTRHVIEKHPDVAKQMEKIRDAHSQVVSRPRFLHADLIIARFNREQGQIGPS